jgi:hypothetical protein
MAGNIGTYTGDRHRGRYVLSYRKLPEDLRKQVDYINKLRNYRAIGGGLTAVGLGALLAGAGKTAPVATAITGGGAAHAVERIIVHETKRLGELLRSRYSVRPIYAPAYHTEHPLRLEIESRVELKHPLTEPVEPGEASHFHIDRNKNLVFTSELEHAGSEIVPKALRPSTWRWRMKVPLHTKHEIQGRARLARLLRV